MTGIPRFADLAPVEPDHEALRAAYVAVAGLAADDDVSVIDAVTAWEAASRPVREWQAWARLRFYQDTRDADRKDGRQRADVLESLLKELDDAVLAALLGRADQDALEAVVSGAVVARWRADRASFDPAIADDLVTEQDLVAEYLALCAEAKIPFGGQEHTLVTINKEAISTDRDTRHGAEGARWGWFDDNTEQLDRVYDDLVRLRTKMARAMGMFDYVSLGYLHMHRIDYDRQDVQRFRSEVRTRVVPLAAALMEEQRARLGVSAVHLWDEEFGDPAGPPPLLCSMDGLGEAGIDAFDRLDPAIGAFYRQLHEGRYLDLGTRPGKAGGGFCTWLDAVRSPFVFCSGNGTAGDARTLVHEVGHAFQCWSSRESPVSTCVFPTYESAEIHSMGLEHLAWPVLDTFFGDRTDDFRRDHLVRGLRFIPYGVAVDHFQHLVYENPDASPADRHGMWQEMERTYLPWRDYGDLPHVGKGGLWQRQRHIYGRPFYYIDYTLALTCALQLWAASLDDHAGTMERFHGLCGKGGTLAFQDLCASADLNSPFQAGCLDDVVARAEEWLAAH